MSKEYVEKEAVKDVLENAFYGEATFGELLEAIDNAPSADVAPVARGKWIGTLEEDESWKIECSICGERAMGFVWSVDICGVDEYPNYCPNCGAEMRKEENDER